MDSAGATTVVAVAVMTAAANVIKRIAFTRNPFTYFESSLHIF